jgi:hypothetical protein
MRHECYETPMLPLPEFTIWEPEHRGPIDTGLLDAEGKKIYRARQPIGFDLRGRDAP